jgi:hypothetical protein
MPNGLAWYVVVWHFVLLVLWWVALVARAIVVATAWLVCLPYATVSTLSSLLTPTHHLRANIRIRSFAAQLWLFRVYISSADGFGSTVHAIVNEPVKTIKANRTTPTGFAKLTVNATLNATEAFTPVIRAVRVVGTTPNKAGDLRALFEPLCSARPPPTGWSKTIR